MVSWRQDATEDAARYVREGLRIGQAAGAPDRNVTALSFELLAWIAAGQGRWRRACTLLAAADTMLTDIGQRVPPMLVADHGACERQTRAALGDAAFTRTFQRGRSLSFDDALGYALEEPPEPVPAAPATPDPAAPPTRREHEVAVLIAEGLSNKAIAAALVISRRTAEGHVEHILSELGFSNRSQIAALITTRRPAL